MYAIENRSDKMKKRINFLCSQGENISIVNLLKDFYGQYSAQMYEQTIAEFKILETQGLGKLVYNKKEKNHNFISKRSTKRQSKINSIIAEIDFYISLLQEEKDENIVVYLEELLGDYYPDEIIKAFIALELQGIGKFIPGKNARFEVGPSEIEVSDNNVFGPSAKELQEAMFRIKAEQIKNIRE